MWIDYRIFLLDTQINDIRSDIHLKSPVVKVQVRELIIHYVMLAETLLKRMC